MVIGGGSAAVPPGPPKYMPGRIRTMSIASSSATSATVSSRPVKDAAPVAYASIVLLGGALAAVVYLGNRAGPSTPPARTAAAPTVAAEPTRAAAPVEPTPIAPTPATPDPGSGRFVASADLSAEEQLALERLNEVRAAPPSFVPAWRRMLAADPSAKQCGEPADMLDPILGYAPRQPLAANQQLVDAARKHARDQLDRGYFEHVSPEGVSSNERVIAAGYPLPVDRRLDDEGHAYSSEHGVGNIESLHMAARTGGGDTRFGPDACVHGIDGLVIDACIASRGHRLHLLGARGPGAIEDEIGLGVVTGTKPDPAGTRSELQMVIEIATRGDGGRFVLGVVYRDADGDHAYDAGEGQAGVEVAVPGAGVHTRTAPGGGYALPVPATFAGELVAAGQRLAIAASSENVKLDVVVE